MNAQPQFFFLMVAGWVNRQQQAIIEYLQTENNILLEQLGGKPKRFTDAQRMRLARKAKVVGRRRLRALSTMVTPDTLLRWFRVRHDSVRDTGANHWHEGAKQQREWATAGESLPQIRSILLKMIFHFAKSMPDSISVAGGPANPRICVRGSDVLPTATDRVVLSLVERNRNDIGCFRGSNEIRPHAWWAVKPTPQSSNGLGGALKA